MLEAPIKKGSGLFIRGAKTKIEVGACSFIGIYALYKLHKFKQCFLDIKMQKMLRKFTKNVDFYIKKYYIVTIKRISERGCIIGKQRDY